MEMGSRIYELRKKNNLSQENLAEKIGVARQTISKWELGETSPDIKQAKQLAQIFNVSLDELTGNDVREVLIEKVSNTEKLAGMVIKILKVLGILILISILFTVIGIVMFTAVRKETSVEHEKTVMCLEENVGDNKYLIEIGTDGTFHCSGLTLEMENDIWHLVNFDDLAVTEDNIERYFSELRKNNTEE